jgi:hypothetical protein
VKYLQSVKEPKIGMATRRNLFFRTEFAPGAKKNRTQVEFKKPLPQTEKFADRRQTEFQKKKNHELQEFLGILGIFL